MLLRSAAAVGSIPWWWSTSTEWRRRQTEAFLVCWFHLRLVDLFIPPSVSWRKSPKRVKHLPRIPMLQCTAYSVHSFGPLWDDRSCMTFSQDFHPPPLKYRHGHGHTPRRRCSSESLDTSRDASSRDSWGCTPLGLATLMSTTVSRDLLVPIIEYFALFQRNIMTRPSIRSGSFVRSPRIDSRPFETRRSRGRSGW